MLGLVRRGGARLLLSPCCVAVKEGEAYFWCSCGASKKQPFCDGSHVAFNRTHGTTYKSVKYIAEKTGDVYFCTCKRTKEGVMCDGSHNLPEEEE